MSDNMQELLFCCDANEQQSCAAWDFRTGTNLMTYKGGGGGSGNAGIQPRSLCILRAEYVLAASANKPLLHVWPINAQEQINAVRFVTPGRVSALAVSPDGLYLVAGIAETIYLWHLATGRMLNTLAKHYQPVACLRFTDDSSHFVSAGQDGGVLVWNLTQVVARGSGAPMGDDNQTPLYSFADHGLPVTDVHVGAGGMRAYMWTVSLDRTCRIYDLSSGTLLLTVVFAEALHCVTANALETCVYVGTAEGNIYEFHIDAMPRTKEYHMEKEHSNRFVGHKAGTVVSCLALSLDGQTLVSGGQDAQICIWHIPSRQLLKTMPHKGGAVTNLCLRLTNPAIFHPEHKQPHVFGGNLRRMIDPPDVEEEEVIEVLVTEQEASEREAHAPVLLQQNGTTRATTVGQAATGSDSAAASVEIKKLRAEVAHLKRVNKKLFEVSAKELLRSKKQ